MKVKQSILFFVALLSVSGCQNELADRYLNPDKTTFTTPDKLFTALLNNNRVRPSYWEMSTFVNWHIGIYTQSVGFLNSESMYQQNESYIQDRWNDFYRPSSNGAGVVALYREMERSYGGLAESGKPNYEIFLKAAQVILYDQATQMVDLWGDIPFSEAGKLNETGDIVYPKFDEGREIYLEAIQNLKSLSDYFGSAKLTSFALSTFARQDILLNGDVDHWRRYANSLRLRLLMRISFEEEAFAREEVQAMLSDVTGNPLLNDDGYSSTRDDILLRPLENYTDDLHAAFADWINYPAPYYLLEGVLNPANDLRIPVLFDKFGVQVNDHFTPNADYHAIPLTLSRSEQQASLGKYAIIDSVTFLNNSKLPGVVMTTSEVNFLKAEAFERWGGGDAASEYLKGIEHSIEFYFYLNNLNTGRATLTPPSANAINAFLTSSTSIQYTGTTDEKLSRIWIQKWVHFGFLQSVQSWAELRRTSLPSLLFNPSPLTGYGLPPNRLTYPVSEKTFNANYQSVAANDKRGNKIFWAVR